MSSGSALLRLGTTCAVFDEEGRVLLSLREDFKLWNMPGGRVDGDELLHEAAAREVWEETGLQVEIERPVGLYYSAGMQSLRVLYRARVTGGSLKQETDETLGNRFFALDALPTPLLHPQLIHDAISGGVYLRTLKMPFLRLQTVRLALAGRYVRNLLSGRPEPRHKRFNIRAVALVFNKSRTRLLTVHSSSTGEGAFPTLPYVQCEGRMAPHDELGWLVHEICPDVTLHWVGLWQCPASDALDFIYAATLDETSTVHSTHWTALEVFRNSNTGSRFHAYIEQTLQHDGLPSIWTLHDASEHP